ncbi:hypothetical protein QTO01_20380 [Vibrio mytili]|uniref:hypothetical protein n=1 Tax=Vibrio mytili TaxID=50718 RepID=UPI002F403862
MLEVVFVNLLKNIIDFPLFAIGIIFVFLTLLKLRGIENDVYQNKCTQLNAAELSIEQLKKQNEILLNGLRRSTVANEQYLSNILFILSKENVHLSREVEQEIQMRCGQPNTGTIYDFEKQFKTDDV